MRRTIFAALVIAAMASAPAFAIECGTNGAVFSSALHRIPPPNSVIALKKGDDIAMIAVIKVPNGTDDTSWELLQKLGDQTCVIAKGDNATLLPDARSVDTAERYGMPGSGHPRCGKGIMDTGLPASAHVRFWANQELGDSMVFALEKALDSSFTVLTSTDNVGPWIVLNSKGDEACYFDRGDSSVITLDMKP